jgi:hypothetical protein
LPLWDRAKVAAICWRARLLTCQTSNRNRCAKMQVIASFVDGVSQRPPLWLSQRADTWESLAWEPRRCGMLARSV